MRHAEASRIESFAGTPEEPFARTIDEKAEPESML
jgi:hypothetical protein